MLLNLNEFRGRVVLRNEFGSTITVGLGGYVSGFILLSSVEVRGLIYGNSLLSCSTLAQYSSYCVSICFLSSMEV